MEARTNSSENLDTLGLKSSKTITKQLETEEQILLSCDVEKHNKKSVIQKRSLLITNKYVYNIDFKDKKAQLFSFLMSSSAIKRKIAIVNIEAITLSTYYLSDQFILHVPKEYDYRFSGVGKKRESILKFICKEYQAATGKKMTFYLIENPDLKDFQTTEQDAAAGTSKMPKENAVLLSEEDFEKKGLTTIMKTKRLSKVDVVRGPSGSACSEEVREKVYNPANTLDNVSMTESVVVTK